MLDSTQAAPDSIIDGTVLAAKVTADVATHVAELKARGIRPGLTVVLVGDDAASAVYVGSKERTCIELGMFGETIRRPSSITQDELLAIVAGISSHPQPQSLLL